MKEIESDEESVKKSSKDMKIIIVGDMSTGKTSIIQQYLNNKLSEDYQATIVPEFHKKIIISKDIKFVIQFWDLPGQDRNITMTNVFCKDTQGIILVCDINSDKTIENIKNWYDSIGNRQEINNIPKIILANKCDLLKDENKKKETLKTIKDISDEIGCINYFSTSALKGDNIKESIDYLINEMIKLAEEEDINKYVNNSVYLRSDRSTSNSGCTC